MSTIVIHDKSHRARAVAMVVGAPFGHRVTVAEPKHSTEQRGKLNAMCGDIAKQYVHNGRHLKKDEVRHLIAGMVFKADIVANLEGDGVVSLYPSTADMSVKQLNAMIEGAYYIGALKGVVWTDPESSTAGSGAAVVAAPVPA